MSEVWLDTARDLLAKSSSFPPGPFQGQVASFIASCLENVHPDRELFTGLTARAMTRGGFDEARAAALAGDVFRSYLRTQYVDKLLVSTRTRDALSLVQASFDASALAGKVSEQGGAILCSFHFRGYPLLPLAFLLRSLPVVFLRARPDVMEANRKIDDFVIYGTDRTAPVRMVRALRSGKHVFVMADQVDAKAETAEVRLFGRHVKANVGLAWLAEKANAPIVPVVLGERGGQFSLEALDPIIRRGSRADTMQDVFAALEAAVLRDPSSWLTWYGSLDDADARALRERLKTSNDALWTRMVKS